MLNTLTRDVVSTFDEVCKVDNANYLQKYNLTLSSVNSKFLNFRKISHVVLIKRTLLRKKSVRKKIQNSKTYLESLGDDEEVDEKLLKTNSHSSTKYHKCQETKFLFIYV